MRYACEVIDSIWSEQSKLERWLTVWQAQLQAVGWPMPALDISSFEQRVADAERVTGHDVAAALEVVRGRLIDAGLPQQAKWLHYGLCSSDVVDAGYLLGIAEAEEQLQQLSLCVTTALRELSTRQKNVQTLYRTHGQAAQIANGDCRWLGYADEMTRLVKHASFSVPSRFGLQGPTGTGGALSMEQAGQIAVELDLHLSFNVQGRQAADRTSWASWLHSVASLATLAQRVATQVRLLAYEEVGEVSEGRDDGYVGSSSMPHKSQDGRSNPTRSERICGLAAVIRGLTNAYAEAASSVWDSHSLEHSCADRLLIPQVTGLTGFVLTELADVLTTLRINTNRTRQNAEVPNAQWGGEDSYTRRNRLLREQQPDQDEVRDSGAQQN